MLFNSITFLIFLPIVVIVYYLLNPRYRWLLLLGASYYFYMSWEPEYALLMLSSTVVDYIAGIRMSRNISKNRKRKYIFLSLTYNLGVLFFFKYFNFIDHSLYDVFKFFDHSYNTSNLNVLLPVGISFYTFQSLSYSLEIYNGKQKAERHFGIFALYISFFPQLVAGPIERFSHLGGQLKQYFDFRWDNISNGLRLILFGLFVKMVIADNISSYVDEVYQNFNQFNSGSILQGLFLYSFQIYADFYGYSIIAIGSARLLGIDLMNNFASPYLAKSIPEFWNRWHISLSTWFKDYLFIPLGGSRVKISRFYLNILVIFTVSGLWHGANWTFLIWGFLHAVFYILYNYLVKRFNIKFNEDNWSVINVSRAIVNFLLVTFAWIFFRSSTFTEAISLIKSIYFNINLIDSFSIPIHVFILLFIFIVSDILFSKNRIDVWLQNKSYFVRWSIYFVIVFLILTQSGVNNNPFIYFQF